jgi:hypothetical protein
MRGVWTLALCLAVAGLAWAGPVEFGKQELERAIAGRRLSPQRFRVVTEVTVDPQSRSDIGRADFRRDVRG